MVSTLIFTWDIFNKQIKLTIYINFLEQDHEFILKSNIYLAYIIPKSIQHRGKNLSIWNLVQSCFNLQRPLMTNILDSILHNSRTTNSESVVIQFPLPERPLACKGVEFTEAAALANTGSLILIEYVIEIASANAE